MKIKYDEQKKKKKACQLNYKKLIKIILFFWVYIYFQFKEKKFKNNSNLEENSIETQNQKKINLTKKNFIIVRRENDSLVGLGSLYATFIATMKKYFPKGYIPIFDIGSYGNIINGYKINKYINHWELFFEQPFGFKLKDVEKMENVKILRIPDYDALPFGDIYKNETDFKIYIEMGKHMKIKKDIIDEAKTWMKNELGNSKNGIGVFARGTDILIIKPDGLVHPTPEVIMKDIDKMNKKYKFDWIFLCTEDKKILEKFIKKYGNKLKYIKEELPDYKGGFLGTTPGINGNIERNRNYLKKIYILSKCKYLLACRTSAQTLLMILTNGFKDMNAKMYDMVKP